ncbi:MAG: SRPBCC domain-containing protein [Sphingobacteriales bacterium]|nr:MAG: SRPBCC domain-containing protein [Sphingobacteriales bacterium]
MKQEPFVIERTLNAPVARVWKAITDKAQMKEWYFDVSGFKPEVGYEFEFSGTGQEGENYKHICKVLEAIPNEKLSYSWSYEGYEGYSVLTFELFEEGNKTRLKVTHDGLESFPQDNPSFARGSFAGGWNALIGELLPAYVETGTIIKTAVVDASKEEVWDMLTNDAKVKRWANAFYEGTYAESDWKEGSGMVWRTADGNIAAKGKILNMNKPVLLEVMFEDDGVGSDDPLHIYIERYKVTEKDSGVVLQIEAGPLRKKHIEGMEPMWDNAIVLMKQVAEGE